MNGISAPREWLFFSLFRKIDLSSLCKCDATHAVQGRRSFSSMNNYTGHTLRRSGSRVFYAPLALPHGEYAICG